MEIKPYKVGKFIVGMCIFDTTPKQEIDYAELGIAPPKDVEQSDWALTAISIDRIEAIYPSINNVDESTSVKLQLIDDAYDMQGTMEDILPLLQ